MAGAIRTATAGSSRSPSGQYFQGLLEANDISGLLHLGHDLRSTPNECIRALRIADKPTQMKVVSRVRMQGVKAVIFTPRTVEFRDNA